MACRAFSTTGVDVTDLGDVPKSLRVVLEEALCEPPSQQSLDRYLPTIRQIIINLLRNLKAKQSMVRGMGGPPTATRDALQHEPTKESRRIDLYRALSEGSHPRPAKLKPMTPKAPLVRISPPLNVQGIGIQGMPGSGSNGSLGTSGSVESLNRAHNHEDHGESSHKPTTQVDEATTSSALKQLQNGDLLKRRALRRFLAYQYAKLTKQTEMPLPKEESAASPQKLLPAAAIVPERTPDRGEKIVFLRLGNRTKKATLPSPLSSNLLRLLFIEKFAYLFREDSFPEIYVQPLMAEIPYELEEDQLGEIQLGWILSLNQDDAAVKGLEALVQALKNEVSALRGLLGGEMGTIRTQLDSMNGRLATKTVERVVVERVTGEIPVTKEESPAPMIPKVEPVPSGGVSAPQITIGPDGAPQISMASNIPAHSVSAPQISGAIGKSAPISKLTTIPGSSLGSEGALSASAKAQISEIRHLTSVAKQISADTRRDAAATIKQLLGALAQFKSALFDAPRSANRSYMETCHSKLLEDSDQLLTKVDDLQDVIEALRKDVAQRGAKPSEEQLSLVRRDVESAQKQIETMHLYIVTEKPTWKSIWERELDIVCEEQQFFKLQEDLVDDLKEDLQKALETFTLVEHVLREHQKTKNLRPRQPALPLVEPGTNMNEVRDAMLSEVAALRPNHQNRVDAIEKAEKVREMEKQARLANRFEQELGGFVEGKKLKKSGGIEETERLRREKDEQNLKNLFAVF